MKTPRHPQLPGMTGESGTGPGVSGQALPLGQETTPHTPHAELPVESYGERKVWCFTNTHMKVSKVAHVQTFHIHHRCHS